MLKPTILMPHIANIPYEDLRRLNASFEDAFKERLTLFLNKGWYILGDEVRAFEADFAAYCGAGFAVGVASGLDALTLSWLALDLPKGSEILVPSNTYIASILSVIQAGLVPVLVEPDRITYNLDPNRLESAITPKTRGILPVHLYGKPCDMRSIMAIATTHNLAVVEDCAQAHGARFEGQMVGTFGDFGAYSFYPTKNLGALGDAGAIVTNNEAMATRLKTIRNYGSSVKYHNDEIGMNSRLDELQASFLQVKLPFLDQIVAKKRHFSNFYFASLDSRLSLPSIQESSFDVYHIFNVLHPRRDAIRDALTAQGIATEIHYPIAPHRQPALADYFAGQAFPISERIHAQTLSLPISFAHTDADILRVCEAINSVVDALG